MEAQGTGLHGLQKPGDGSQGAACSQKGDMEEQWRPWGGRQAVEVGPEGRERAAGRGWHLGLEIPLLDGSLWRYRGTGAPW